METLDVSGILNLGYFLSSGRFLFKRRLWDSRRPQEGEKPDVEINRIAVNSQSQVQLVITLRILDAERT